MGNHLPSFVFGVILRDVSPGGSCAHRHRCRELNASALLPKMLRKLSITPW